MEQDEDRKMEEFSLISFFLTTSLCFFSFSGLLALLDNNAPKLFLWIAFISLFIGLLCGIEKILFRAKRNVQ